MTRRKTPAETCREINRIAKNGVLSTSQKNFNDANDDDLKLLNDIERCPKLTEEVEKAIGQFNDRTQIDSNFNNARLIIKCGN
ncbi:hypothetical protein L596_001432 [Steinernema carpocapsae]|uniref:Uncharacterized protein n=1 Tax=Steinernema carpocapsae TaxID=34508 RepID=A0A4U8ULJ5_STECR|nr:hypothetical protein L596_001432 [Steinernema carpocapsae]